MGTNTSPLPPTLSTEQLAVLAGVNKRTVWDLARRGQPVIGLHPVRVGARVLWPTSKVCAQLALDETRAAEILGLADTAMAS